MRSEPCASLSLFSLFAFILQNLLGYLKDRVHMNVPRSTMNTNGGTEN